MSQSPYRWELKCVCFAGGTDFRICMYILLYYYPVYCCVLFLLWFNSKVLLHTGNTSIVQTASQRTAEIKVTVQCAGMCIKVFQNHHHDNINLKNIH